MRKDEIKVGKTYRIKSYNFLRNKVVVTGDAEKPRGGAFEFPVEYPLGVKGKVPSRDFLREWTQEDDERAAIAKEAEEDAEALMNGFMDLGYTTARVYTYGGGHVQFSVDDGRKILEVLNRKQ